MKQHDRFLTGGLLTFLLGYPTSVMAAVAWWETGPMGVEWVKYGYVLLMASWGAAAALLQRFAKGEGTDKWKLIVWRDFVNATLAAVLTFWVCEHFKVPAAIEAVAFTLAAYGGARFMEFIYGRFIAGVKVGTTAYVAALTKPAPLQDESKKD